MCTWKNGKRVILIGCAENSLGAIIFNFSKRKMKSIMFSTIMERHIIIMSVHFSFSILRIYGSIGWLGCILCHRNSIGLIWRYGEERECKGKNGKRVTLIGCAGKFSRRCYYQF